MRYPVALVAATATAAFLALVDAGAQQPVFKGGVAVVEVPATVTDGDGRFITGLTRDDFVVYDDGKPQEIVAFSSERVPVSLGVLLDVSLSMSEAQLATARLAIDHFAHILLGTEDELFLIEFAARGRMLQPWTRNRDSFSRALTRANQTTLMTDATDRPATTDTMPNFGTAVFDAVATSLEIAATGVHAKRAVLVISDGKDTSSRRSVMDVQEAIRTSEILVYALAVDSGEGIGLSGPVYGGVDAGALRKLTDDTGGRTEVVKGFKNLAQATARLADEFNQQYLISYVSPLNRDGRWHPIKVDVRKRGATIRARAGYIAS